MDDEEPQPVPLDPSGAREVPGNIQTRTKSRLTSKRRQISIIEFYQHLHTLFMVIAPNAILTTASSFLMDIKTLMKMTPTDFTNDFTANIQQILDHPDDCPEPLIRRACLETYLGRLLPYYKTYLLTVLRDDFEQTAFYVQIWIRYITAFSEIDVFDGCMVDYWNQVIISSLPETIKVFIASSGKAGSHVKDLFQDDIHWSYFYKWHKDIPILTPGGGCIMLKEHCRREIRANMEKSLNSIKDVEMPTLEPCMENMSLKWDRESPTEMLEVPSTSRVSVKGTMMVIQHKQAQKKAYEDYCKKSNILKTNNPKSNMKRGLEPVTNFPEEPATSQSCASFYDAPIKKLYHEEGEEHEPEEKPRAILLNLDSEVIKSLQVGLKLEWRILIPTAPNTEAMPNLFMMVHQNNRCDSKIIFWCLSPNGQRICSNYWTLTQKEACVDNWENDQILKLEKLYRCEKCEFVKHENTIMLKFAFARIMIDFTRRTRIHSDQCTEPRVGATHDLPQEPCCSKEPHESMDVEVLFDDTDDFIEMIYRDCVCRVRKRISTGRILTLDDAKQNFDVVCHTIRENWRRLENHAVPRGFAATFDYRCRSGVDKPYFEKDIWELWSKAYWCILFREFLSQYIPFDQNLLHERAYEISKWFNLKLVKNLIKFTDEERTTKLSEYSKVLLFPVDKTWDDIIIHIFGRYNENIQQVKKGNMERFEVPVWFIQKLQADYVADKTVKKVLNIVMAKMGQDYR